MYFQEVQTYSYDMTPLILKEAAASHPVDEFIFFRKDEYDVLLKKNPQAIIGDLFSFTINLKHDISSNFETKNIPIRYKKDNNPNHLQITAEIPQDGYLIRKENYHKGWSAKVNNIKTPIEKYGGVFQAIKVNKGKVVVDFEFISLYPLFMWLHIIFVYIGYFIYFYYLIRQI